MNIEKSIHKNVWFSLLLIIPIPTLSILYSMEISQGWSGNLIFVLSKISLIIIPLYWYFKLENRQLSWSPVKEKNDLFVGFMFGIFMSAVIAIAWFLFEDSIDLFHPFSRRENTYCKSIVNNNEFVNLANEIILQINENDDLGKLNAFMNPMVEIMDNKV